ncbi:hypothetical protein [Parageobacillus toebii]|uniref:CRISPR system ring nuclease SSO1393-like domain-containing protein n=1 Tax=Parageobacillus toebii TaxID=153151 RepID=A0A150MQ98_9BACL|nr:hypothetical protein [Parageobacillus toebii]KYD26552.1 hypothetical protein B4110_3785 [Parageobacillus toebii]
MKEIMTIITTVGSSLFTNFVKEKGKLKDQYNDLKDLLYCESNLFDYEEYIQSFKGRLPEYIQENKNACAEISSIKKIIEKIKDKTIHIHLLASQTILSWLSATIIKEKLEEEGYVVHFEEKKDIIAGLQVKDAKRFEKEGLVNFVDRVLQISNYGYNTVLNITGGYKALIPYATLLSQFYQMPMFYLFGDTFTSKEEYTLIEFPQSPVTINWGMFEKYEYVLRDLKEGIEDWDAYKREHNIEDDFNACISTTDGKDAFLNAIGEMFYQKYQQFQMVYVLQNGPLSKVSRIKERQILNKEIGELVNRLNQFIQNNGLENASKEEVFQAVEQRGGENLSHASRQGDDFFICKSPIGNIEVRLLYTFGNYSATS